MPTLHMTDVVVSRLKEPGTYFDETTPAFAIRVGKNRKTWFVIRGRERLRTNIGQYPQTSLADARKEAKRLLTEEPSKHATLRFEEAYERFKESIATKKARTQRDYKRVLDKHLLPTLRRKKLAEIEYDDVVNLTKHLPPSEAAHTLAVARTFFRWCVRPPRRYIAHSPLEGVQIKLAKKRKRILKDDELAAVWNAANEQGYPHGTVVQLLILTGQRKGEIAALRWPWIDQKAQTITLPGGEDGVTKNKLEHTFPYDGRVSAILATIPRRNSTDLLFPSRDSEERPISGWSKFKAQISALIPKVEGWTLHDLRRTFRSKHGEIGTDRTIAERLIGHAAGVTTDVETIYDRWTYMPQMREAIERFEKHLDILLAR
jgi:integrase